MGEEESGCGKEERKRERGVVYTREFGERNRENGREGERNRRREGADGKIGCASGRTDVASSVDGRFLIEMSVRVYGGTHATIQKANGSRGKFAFQRWKKFI